MSFTIAVLGLKAITDKVGKINAASRKAILRGTFKAALLVQKEARTGILKSPKEGNEYFHGGRGKKTRASKPGTPPTNQTGALQRGIVVSRKDISGDVATAVVSATAEYSAAQEFGTQTLPERPFMLPALEKNRAKIDTMIRDEVRQAVKSAT